jgi:hypothetical protein
LPILDRTKKYFRFKTVNTRQKIRVAKANYIGALKQTLTNKSISWEIQKTNHQTDFNWEYISIGGRLTIL